MEQTEIRQSSWGSGEWGSGSLCYWQCHLAVLEALRGVASTWRVSEGRADRELGGYLAGSCWGKMQVQRVLGRRSQLFPGFLATLSEGCFQTASVWSFLLSPHYTLTTSLRGLRLSHQANVRTWCRTKFKLALCTMGSDHLRAKSSLSD